MKKNKQLRYLPLYYRCMEAGELPKRGLCWSIGDPVSDPSDATAVIFTNPDLLLFLPSADDAERNNYWGYGEDILKSHYSHLYGFTPLRQTIVLFLAAMNDEL